MSDLLNSASLVMIPSGYKEDVVYSQIPTDGSGDLSFTRASNGTRINSAGFVEVCPWNEITYSEDFTNAAWTKVNTTITANSTTAPNGTNTATKFESVASGVPQLSRAITGTNTISIYAKAGNISNFRIWIGSEVIFDLSTGTVTAGTATMENVGNGWYRCIISATTAASFNPYFVASASGQYVYIWGAQVNIGSTAKPYFPTTDRLNVPRLTYQNGGGGCPSLLLEKQSTNLNLYSQDLTNAAYATGGSGGTVTTTANYGISPDGTQNATRIQISRNTGASSYAEIYQRISVTVGTTYTLSFYAKSLSGTPTLMTSFNDGYFNEVTFTTDWVKYTYTFVAAGAYGSGFNLLTYTPLTNTSVSADLLVWGVQLEASSYATSYIPTTSSSATRVKDVCYKNSISSLIGQSSGVVFADIVPFQFLDGSYIGISDNASTSNRQIFGFEADSGNSGTLRFYGWYTVSSITCTAGQRYKIAMAYANNDFVCYVNGTQVVNETSGTVTGTLSHFGFDSWVASSQNFQGQINQAALFKTRLTNAELASLTTL